MKKECHVMEEQIIKYVAIYLRKSRGDDESALDKHKLVLTDLCKENRWKYVIYEEIMSGDSIVMRPVFSELLEDVTNRVFDAVVVMDIDRLGRGNQADQGTINQAFSNSDTYIVTPQQIFNLNNDDDEFVVDMKSFISRREYKQIVKRLVQGKKIGSRQGNWTNGKPPYPYEYERYNNKYNPKGLVINDEKLVYYRYMLDSIVNENKSPKQISIELNEMNIPSPRGGLWHGNTVYRILIDETHLGKIISNKTKGDGHVKKKPNAKPQQALPKGKWVVVNNCHEPVKTQVEHDKILIFLSRLSSAPRRTQNKILPLSGLIKCGICGHTMGVWRRKDRKDQDTLKSCWYKDEFGLKCNNKGMILEFLYDFLYRNIGEYEEELEKLSKDVDINNNKLKIEQSIISLNGEMKNKNKALERILEAFENGLYTLEQFRDRKTKVDNSIEDLKNKAEILELEYKSYTEDNIQDKLSKVKNCLKIINNDDNSDEEKNKAYKNIIKSIEWTRTGDDISIKINYL